MSIVPWYLQHKYYHIYMALFHLKYLHVIVVICILLFSVLTFVKGKLQGKKHKGKGNSMYVDKRATTNFNPF